MLRDGSQIHHARAVAELLLLNSELIQQRQKKIRHGRVRSDANVTSAFHLPRSAADQKNKKRIMVMLVTVAERATIKNEHVIQQSSIAFQNLLQPVEEIRQGVHMVFIQHRKLIHV